MQVAEYNITFRQADNLFKLYMLGDVHCGTIHCAENLFKHKVIQIANEPNSYWIGMGDYGEYILPRDKRFDPSQKSIAEWVSPDDIAECQRRWLVKTLSPIKDKCIGLLYGNHENNYRIFNYSNVQQHVCDDLDVPNLGYSCFLNMRFKRENSNETHVIKGVFTHGSSSAITDGAKKIILGRFMTNFRGQMYGYGHMHDILASRRSYLEERNGIIQQVDALGVVTGSWFRTYTQGVIASYGEQKAYPPTVIGSPYFLINATSGTITQSE